MVKRILVILAVVVMVVALAVPVVASTPSFHQWWLQYVTGQAEVLPVGPGFPQYPDIVR